MKYNVYVCDEHSGILVRTIATEIPSSELDAACQQALDHISDDDSLYVTVTFKTE